MSVRAGIKRFLRWTAAGQTLEGRRGWILSALLVSGALLRLQQWLFCRSLWLDEAALALNIRDRSLLELLSPLDHSQGAAVGFLWMQKALVLFLSDHEMVLRLGLLLAGIASLVLFARLAFSITSGLSPWIALAWFGFNDQQIYYANEAKQYGLDVFWTVLLLLLAVQLLRHAQDRPRVWPLGLLGFLAIWFSHPAVFVLAGIGLVLAWARWRKTLSVSWPRLFAVGGVWCGGFLLAFWVSLRALMANSVLLEYWESGFLPWSWPGGLYWLGRSFVEIFHNPVSLVPWLALPLCVLGGVVLGRANGKHLFLLLLPVLFTLMGAVLHIYPFRGRLVLFLVPVVILLGSHGAGFLAEVCARRWRRFRWVVWAAVGLLALGASWGSLRLTARRVTAPHAREHLRPLLLQMKKEWRPGDRLYIYRQSRPAYEYYRKRLHLGGLDRVEGLGDCRHAEQFKKDLRKLGGARRVWVLVTHHSGRSRAGFDDRDYILDLFAVLGPRRWQRVKWDASLTLFEVEP